MKRLLLVLPFVAIGCKKEEAASKLPDTSQQKVAPKADPCAKAQPKGPIAWIDDDFPAALACAAQREVPVVVDLWAPWCHTCLSMQSTVFQDPSFQTEGQRFVFAALDTDREENAAAVGKLPPSAWPTFYVVGPDGAVLARFVGAASLAQFHAFLDAGAKAMAGGAAGADAHLLGAERAVAVKDLATADQEYTAALAIAPKDWPRRPDVLTSLVSTKQKREDFAGCLALAEQSLDDTGNAAAATDFLVSAMGCADERAKDEPARVQKLRERAAARLRGVIADSAAPLSVDDRSDAMLNLREVLDALGKPDDAKAVAEQQRALLDDTVAKATTPQGVMTYNWPRAEVYAYLKKPLDLVPALEANAKALPAEYDPPARLGWLYMQAGKLDDAAQWTDKALRLSYGPRKAGLLGRRAEIAAKQGDKVAERQYREAAVKLWETLPPAQMNEASYAKAKAAVAALDAPAAGSGSAGSGSAGSGSAK